MENGQYIWEMWMRKLKMKQKEYADGTVHTVTAIVNDNTLKVHTVYVWDKEKTKKQALGANRTVSSPTVFRHNA